MVLGQLEGETEPVLQGEQGACGWRGGRGANRRTKREQGAAQFQMQSLSLLILLHAQPVTTEGQALGTQKGQTQSLALRSTA